jgi:glycosyltransferase involved in cell wall biosynthesis
MEKRIFIFTSEFPPGPGGIGDHAYNLACQFKEHGFEVSVLSELRTEFQKGSNKEVHQLMLLPRTPLFHLKFALAFLRLARQHRNGLFIASGSRCLALAGVYLFFFRQRSMAILHGHEAGMDGAIKKWIIRKTLRLFSSAVAVSNFSRGNFLKYRGDVEVITNGYNPEKFSKVIPSSRSTYSSTVRILTVGTVSKRKGQMNVIRALPMITKEFPSIVYHMAGITYYSAFLEQSLRENSHAKMLGVVPDKDMPDLFADHDVFIMLSENTSEGNVEGFGIAIIEANHFGLPAIGSKGCGIEDAIKDGLNGRLVDPHSPDEILAALEDILENYPAYSAKAIEWAASHQWGKVIVNYIQLINKLLN